MKTIKQKSAPVQHSLVRTANDQLDKGRVQQKLRTRRALLEAAGILLKRGISPSVAEAAKMAGISRATAYRYFPTADLLLVEAPFELDIPSAAEIFGSGKSALLSIENRVDALERAIHKVCIKENTKIRLFFRISMDRWLAREQTGAEMPLRQGRRIQLIDAALQPIRHTLPAQRYKTLSAALAMIVGIESAISLTDVLRLSASEARRVKRWAVHSLVRAALSESLRPLRSEVDHGPRRNSLGRPTAPAVPSPDIPEK